MFSVLPHFICTFIISGESALFFFSDGLSDILSDGRVTLLALATAILKLTVSVLFYSLKNLQTNNTVRSIISLKSNKIAECPCEHSAEYDRIFYV